MAPVGVIVNPWAGKDVRRLHAPVGHTPDTAKIGIVRRIVIAALEAGAERVLAADDTGRLAARAIDGIDRAVLVDGPATGSMLDTRRAAAQLTELGCAPIVVLGGDGTCRDVALGARQATIVAVSTGTNNVFPSFVDGSSAGAAAGVIASGGADPEAVGRRAKLLDVAIEQTDTTTVDDLALVDVALLDGDAIGARAVLRAASIRRVIATIASPASTGLSSIAGRLRPMGRHERGAVDVRLGQHGRRITAPIVPGAFDAVTIESVATIGTGESLVLDGPGVLSFDGERQHVLHDGARATVTLRDDGPLVIDVECALRCAVARQLFDVTADDEIARGD